MDEHTLYAIIAILLLLLLAIAYACWQRKRPMVPFTLDGQIYVINLDRHLDRLRHFTATYNRSDLARRAGPFIRFVGVDAYQKYPGDAWKNYLTQRAVREAEDSEANGFRMRHYEVASAGAVGCFHSHYKLWGEALQTPANAIIVFEDDAVFPSSLCSSHLDVAWGSRPRDADIILLSHFCARCYRDSSLWYRVNRFFSTAGYIITRQGMMKCLKHLNPNAINMQIDSVMSKLAASGTLNIYALASKPVSQSTKFETSIQKPLKNQNIEDAWKMI